MTISYADAWSVWFAGGEVDPEALLWGVPVRTVGRAGKIISFVGGATVIFDLIGADRLRRWGADHEGTKRFVSFAVDCLTFGSVIAGFLWIFLAKSAASERTYTTIGLSLVLFAAFFLLILQGRFSDRLSRATRAMLDNENPAQGPRVAGFVLLAVGFHFDVLSS